MIAAMNSLNPYFGQELKSRIKDHINPFQVDLLSPHHLKTSGL